MFKNIFLSIALKSDGAHLFKQWFNSSWRFSYKGKSENPLILGVNLCWNNKNNKNNRNLLGGVLVLTVSTHSSCRVIKLTVADNSLGKWDESWIDARNS